MNHSTTRADLSMKNNKPVKRFHVAALIILLLSWCTYQGYDSRFFFHISTTLKHGINLALLLLIFASGLYGFSTLPQRWLKGIWVAVYAIVIGLMVLLGLLDLFYHFPISNFREMVHNLRMFFSSPVPFGILLLLSQTRRKVGTDRKAVS